MPTIRISDDSMQRLKAWAEPLEDSAEDAFRKVLEAAERDREVGTGAGKSHRVSLTATRLPLNCTQTSPDRLSLTHRTHWTHWTHCHIMT